mgnify:CR=1 FL=1
MKILIVDDSKAMRLIVQRSIRKAGFSGLEFCEAEDGQKGLTAVQENTPDLILSDWNMPEMTGIEFLTELRGQGNQTPFGFITTEGSADLRSQAIDAGANFMLTKPFTPDQVEQALGDYVS